MLKKIFVTLAMTLTVVVFAGAKHKSSHSGSSRAATGVARDSHGRIKRSSAAREVFQAANGLP